MLGTTVNRNGLREDVDNKNYSYSPERPVPSYDARFGRTQDMYDVYAPAEAVTQPPRQYAAPQARPMFQQPTVNPNNVSNRDDELWQRLNTNNVHRSSIESTMNFTPGQPAPFEPIKLRETQSRQQVNRRAGKKLSTQGKVILAVYLAVVLLIVTLVIVNAEMINAPSADADAGAAAVEMFEPNEKGLSFQSSPYNEIAEQTNWFDSFLDKLGE